MRMDSVVIESQSFGSIHDKENGLSKSCRYNKNVSSDSKKTSYVGPIFKANYHPEEQAQEDEEKFSKPKQVSLNLRLKEKGNRFLLKKNSR